MKASMLLFTLAVVCISSGQADVNVSDYVFWKKAYIDKWHEYFPSRVLEEERLTINAATETVSSLQKGLVDYLKKIVAFQYQELDTAKELMGGTDAEGCITGISGFLDQNINDQYEKYQDCTADAPSKLARLINSWSRVNTTYQAAYQRALAGINACAKTYPNKDSIPRLRSCVESMYTNYFSAANNTQSSVFPSPSMTYFQNTVIECASSAANAVVAKGYQFLKMLVNCAELSGTVDPVAYAEELSQWKGYNDTLDQQIRESQNKNYYEVWHVEKEMVDYYNLQKQALEEYVLESRGLDFYLDKVYAYLSDYYNTLTATSLDNPGDSECVNAAKTALDQVANLGATTSLTCDQVIVNDTKRLFNEVFDNFYYLKGMMTTIGNVALLDCISQGYIYAPNTVSDCYRLSSSDFEVEYIDRHFSNLKDIEVVTNYVNNFFNNTDLPCGGTSLKRLSLGADNALYHLQRCLYKSSGSTYEVTTYNPYKTTSEVTTWTHDTTNTTTNSTTPYYS